MMRNLTNTSIKWSNGLKHLRLLTTTLLLAMVFLTSTSIHAWAAKSGENAVESAVDQESSAVKYEVKVQDDADLLTDEEEAALAISMTQLSEYGNILFYSERSEEEVSASKLASAKLDEYFTEDSNSGFCFCIEIEHGKLGVSCDGKLKKKAEEQLQAIVDAFNSCYKEDGMFRGCEAVYNKALEVVSGGTIQPYVHEWPEETDAETEEGTDQNGNGSDQNGTGSDKNGTGSDQSGNGSGSDKNGSDSGEEYIPHEDELQVVNEETGYKALLLDPEGLLTGNEEVELMKTMYTSTQHGNMVFSTTNLSSSQDSEKYAEDSYYQLFGNEDGALFQIDMGNRYLTLSCSEGMEDLLGKERDSIVDNCYKHASDGDYCAAATECFHEIDLVINDGKIAHTMRNIDNAILAVLLGLLLNFILIFATTRVKNHYEVATANVKGELEIGGQYVLRDSDWKHKIERSSSSSSSSSYHHSSSSSSSSSHHSSSSSSGGFSGGSSSHRF